MRTRPLNPFVIVATWRPSNWKSFGAVNQGANEFIQWLLDIRRDPAFHWKLQVV